jgi:hypothetical protein
MIVATSKVISAGDTYGRYVVDSVWKEDGRLFARVNCNCGSPTRYVRADNLRDGRSQSCGCLQREAVTTHGAWSHPLFPVWSRMLSRCENTKDKRYPRYGGRGITVCDRWHDVRKFIEDMQDGYQHRLTIDRIDNDGNYEPANCKWSTRKQQNRNYSRNVILEHDGKRLCVADWAIETGINPKVLYDRVARGWTAARALTAPIKR